MKLAILTLLLTFTASAATTIRSPAARRSLLSKARKLEDEDNEEEEEEEEEYQFLTQYSIKLIGCAAGEKYQNPENGEYEGSSVIFRLCPNTDCDDDTAAGCTEGYGDYVVGINSFVESWLEDKKEDMQQDDNFNVEEYGECREYEVDQDNDDEDGDNQAQYYVGPTCGDEDGSIKLGFFSDYLCTTEPEDVTFEDISNGWSLPYSSGLVTNACESCAGYNDNGEFELSEMCMRLYEDASSKCEEEMEYTYYMGASTSGCEYIAEITPLNAATGSGKTVGWIIFFLAIAAIAFYGYSAWWRKKKAAGPASDGLMN